jgi:hypothetical protein
MTTNDLKMAAERIYKSSGGPATQTIDNFNTGREVIINEPLPRTFKSSLSFMTRISLPGMPGARDKKPNPYNRKDLTFSFKKLKQTYRSNISNV